MTDLIKIDTASINDDLKTAQTVVVPKRKKKKATRLAATPVPTTSAKLIDQLPFSCKEAPMSTTTVEPTVQWQALKTSVRINWLFHAVFLVCVVVLSKAPGNTASIARLFVCGIGIMAYGLIVHWVSHHIQVRPWIDSYDNWFTRNKWIKKLMHMGCDFVDFHSTTHHDTSINKRPINVVYEFLNNALSQGLLVVGLKYLLSWVDNKMLILWAMFYATVHNINYAYVRPLSHRQHHEDALTNYGIDFMDIIFGTKYDWTNFENHNHASINLIVLTALIYGGCAWLQKRR